jgi:hypothetical protein
LTVEAPAAWSFRIKRAECVGSRPEGTIKPGRNDDVAATDDFEQAAPLGPFG